jgi:CRISPR-associated protein Csb2
MPVVLETRLLTGGYEAATGALAPEWPPHPHRLFAALVAAAGQCRTEAETSCLLALEGLDPPKVHASPQLAVSPSYTAYVPNNGREKWGQKGGKPADRRVTPAAPVVWFEWADSSSHVDLDVLDGMASRVAYLGRCSSLVSLRVRSGLAAASDVGTWLPAGNPDAVGEELRVPYSGLLELLDRDFARRAVPSNRHAPARWQRYRLDQGDGFAPVATPWRRLIAWRASGWLPSATLAVPACDALRAESLRLTGDGLPPELSGHDGHGGPCRRGHVAWFPLVNVGVPHADGRIIGFGVALPAGVAEPVMPDHFLLGGNRVDIFPAVAPASRTRPQTWALDRRRWSQPSMSWATATPLALPWEAGRRPTSELTRAIVSSCRKVGLPSPVSVVVGEEPFICGPENAHKYTRSRTSSQGQLTYEVCHAVVHFDRPISGPLAIGPLRHFGLGLMCPLTPEPGRG